MRTIIDYGTNAELVAEDWQGIRIANKNVRDTIYLGEWRPLMDGPLYISAGENHILDQLCKKIVKEKTLVDFLCLGEMTNLAALLLFHPEIESLIGRIIICPGEKDGECRYPVSEKNVLRDPIAAKVIMKSSIPKYIVTEETDGKQRKLVREYLKNPTELEEQPVYVSVQTAESHTYGSLYLDQWDICKQTPNAVLIQWK